MPHAARTALAATLVLLGCSTEVTAPVPRYPVAPRPVALNLDFKPASGVTLLSLPCTKLESEIDNGLDDNCDGLLDRQTEPSKASVFIALSHNTQVDLELRLTASNPEGNASLDKSVVSRVQICQRTEPFAIQQAAFAQLAKGQYELSIVHGKVCGTDLTATVDASLWLEGKAQGVYAVSVPPDGRAVLGTIDVQ